MTICIDNHWLRLDEDLGLLERCDYWNLLLVLADWSIWKPIAIECSHHLL